MTSHEGFRASDHERALELAAARVSEALPPSDEAWLADHLDACHTCAAVAADYDAQHDLFSALRAAQPEAPRDLWARTSAAIEAEHRHRRGVGWRRLFRSPRASTRLALAPIAIVAVAVVVVSASLLNAGAKAPGSPGATPIDAAAAGISLIAQDTGGNVKLLTNSLDEVCPVDNPSCGVAPSFAVTPVNGIGTASSVQGLVSAPKENQLAVVTKDGVYVMPVTPTATPIPSGSKSAPPSIASVAPASSQPATASAVASPSPAVATAAASAPVASGSAEASSPAPSGSFETAPSPSASPAAPSGSPETPASASASESPSSTPSSVVTAAPATPTMPASATPSIAATPAPAAAIRIASGVTVVGAPVYSPDGTQLAFAAVLSNGSAGPDIYLWSAGEKTATPITSDHGSWLAGWTSGGILISRVADGTPSTYLLDPATDHVVQVGTTGVWRPAVAPGGGVAAWWSGTVKLAADGVMWVPDSGQLVLGSWPATTSSAATQVLAKGPLVGWRACWDDTGSVVAVWTDADTSTPGGKLSLYRLDPASGAADLANPLISATAATDDFSLRSRRLAWTAPSAPQTIEVLVWSDAGVVGRLEVPAGASNGTVVP